MLGLPDSLRACVFDLDGVLTSTATVHASAWQQTPGTYLAAARARGVETAAAAVFEDALAGVAAGRPGGFGLAVGVDRLDQADGLRDRGADIGGVSDLDERLPVA